METSSEMISRVDGMASGEPTWDLSKNDMAALEYVMSQIPGSDFYKAPAQESESAVTSNNTTQAEIAAGLQEAIGHIYSGTYEDAIGRINEALRQLSAVR